MNRPIAGLLLLSLLGSSASAAQLPALCTTVARATPVDYQAGSVLAIAQRWSATLAPLLAKEDVTRSESYHSAGYLELRRRWARDSVGITLGLAAVILRGYTYAGDTPDAAIRLYRQLPTDPLPLLQLLEASGGAEAGYAFEALRPGLGSAAQARVMVQVCDRAWQLFSAAERRKTDSSYSAVRPRIIGVAETSHVIATASLVLDGPYLDALEEITTKAYDAYGVPLSRTVRAP